MNREDFNKEYGAKIPEYYDIGLDVSGYMTARSQKREENQRAGKKNRENKFEAFLNVILTYAERMPDSPLLITEEQAAWMVKQLMSYKKWDCDQHHWWMMDAEVKPDLNLNGRPFVVEINPPAEQVPLFG